MKKIILIVLAICLTSTAIAQISFKVDERFELVSLTFALAGVPEFCAQNIIPSYRQDMIDDMMPFDDTEPINFVRKLNIEHRIGYNAVPAFAEKIVIKKGEVIYNPEFDIDSISAIDSRWTPTLASQYIEMLNEFYKQSNFKKWFTDHKTLYDNAERIFNQHISELEMGWFKSFYGEDVSPDVKFYLSLINGPHNYSIENGIVLGVCSDNLGEPWVSQETTSLLVHELGHHYVNSIVDKHWEQMKDAAEIIYSYVEEDMYKVGYSGAKTTTIEWLNELAVIMYYKETKPRYVSIPIYENMTKGFIWMQRSYDFMEHFCANRSIYPTLDDFMGQLAGFLEFTAKNFDSVIEEYEEREPYIVNIFPALSSDITDATEIVLTFSRPMNGSWGWIGSPEGTELLPVTDVIFSEDMLSARLILYPDYIKEGQSYGVSLNVRNFQDEKHFSLREESKDIIFKQSH